ncbi:aldo/keto reductase [Stackebrandtia nassauensis]|uniref:Aldo/keto reductase n=1 Tax=Stackebrandtia nassauensis (strain DSM 44728 / CIP 108903 / NRRL B-16338 / NBRC 102104 / LLR-40K-21) TaxID=446470 RepID=D3Q6H8_STANL|nr:aldo/keto reductase [Stackebrandtia nassauensis]ADD44221.1 aldo/keto reductase [Stackebrandtia nassauensis DSM 44728]
MSNTLDNYRLLGSSGLRVSPLSLGAMTFGDDWGWGSDKADSRRIFDTYLERGGNFIDTANAYTAGTSEEYVGEFAEGNRDRVVIATKYSMSIRAGDPNAGGNGRKALRQSVEQSLRRLRTDHIDLLYLHAWDFTTSADEVMRGLDDLVRSGKVLYIGLSDIPAWQAARMQTIAELRGWEPLAAMQIQYSLIERTVERDLIPMAAELGMGVVPWSPLGSGVLTGKYTRADLDTQLTDDPKGTRKQVAAANGALTPRALDIADVVVAVAKEMEVAPAQVALAWTLLNPAVASPIIGARTLEQLESNLGALEVEFTDEQRERLDAASAIELGFPHDFLSGGMVNGVLHGGAKIQRR